MMQEALARPARKPGRRASAVRRRPDLRFMGRYGGRDRCSKASLSRGDRKRAQCRRHPAAPRARVAGSGDRPGAYRRLRRHSTSREGTQADATSPRARALAQFNRIEERSIWRTRSTSGRRDRARNRRPGKHGAGAPQWRWCTSDAARARAHARRWSSRQGRQRDRLEPAGRVCSRYAQGSLRSKGLGAQRAFLALPNPRTH